MVPTRMDVQWQRVSPSDRRHTREAKALEIQGHHPSSKLFCGYTNYYLSYLKKKCSRIKSEIKFYFYNLKNFCTVQRLQAAGMAWMMRPRLTQWCRIGERETDHARNTHTIIQVCHTIPSFPLALCLNDLPCFTSLNGYVGVFANIPLLSSVHVAQLVERNISKSWVFVPS